LRPLLTLLLYACAPSAPSDPPATLPLELAREEGLAMRIVSGGRLTRQEGTLSVDAPDGLRWIEVRWLEGNPAPAVVAWSTATCEGLVWDRAAAPAPGVRHQTGLCTRQGQMFWTFLAVEQRGDRALMTALLAHRDSVRLEDAWVEWVSSALSLRAGDTPLDTPAEVEVRRLLREKAATTTGTVPVPGGGELGAATAEALAPFWAARMAAEAPAL
jgi:hypothetical protein